MKEILYKIRRERNKMQLKIDALTKECYELQQQVIQLQQEKISLLENNAILKKDKKDLLKLVDAKREQKIKKEGKK